MSRDWEVDASNPQALVARITHDPEAFTAGRRNDDMVNWFLAVLLMAPGQDLGFFLRSWANLQPSFTKHQRSELDIWEVDPPRKVEVLYHHYGHLTDPDAIMALWISQDYQTV